MDDDWQLQQTAERIYFKTRNLVGWATLALGDDSKQVQNHQLEVYEGEVRNGVQRIQEHGLSTMPLPGAKAMVIFHGGKRGLGTAVAVEDARYRPTGLQPGESHGYMVDGAAKDGTGGTMRTLWKGRLGWEHDVFGKTINIGDTNAVTINVGTTASAVTINMGGSSATVNINAGSGDVKVNGVSLVNHTHPDPQGGNTGAPNKS